MSRRLRDRILVGVASAGGFGYLPVAPGTWGTLPAVAIYLAAAYALGEPARSLVVAAALVLSCAATVAVGPWAEAYWQRKDPKRLVLDEVAGFLLVALCYRVGAPWQVALWGFLAARAFDIIKPFPARRCERLPHGWGVLLDDLVASAYAVGALYLANLAAGALGLAWLLRSAKE